MTGPVSVSPLSWTPVDAVRNVSCILSSISAGPSSKAGNKWQLLVLSFIYTSDFGCLSLLIFKIAKGTWLATEFCYKIHLKLELGKTCFIFLPRHFNSFHVNEWYFFSLGNGFVNARASPNMIGTTGANSLGKVMPTKSPPPPGGGSLGVNSRKPDLRVVIPPSGKGMMPPLVC